MPPFPKSCSMLPYLITEGQEGTGNTIFLTRHGESQNNLFGRIGGNAELSDRGEKYAQALSSFMSSLQLSDLTVWTSQYRRTQLTARHIQATKLVQPELGEIKAGK